MITRRFFVRKVFIALCIIAGCFTLVFPVTGCKAAEVPDFVQGLSIDAVSGLSEEVSAFTDVNVVPMNEEKILRDQTVVVEDGRIVLIGSANEVAVPEGAEHIPGNDGFLMPGLADMHMHICQDWEDSVWPVSPRLLYITNGVTTIRDFGSVGESPLWVLRWRDEIETGSRIGPHIISAGEILYASPLADPAASVRVNISSGFDFIKFYSYLSPEDFKAAARTAHDLEIYTAGHIPFMVGLEGALSEGMNEVAHIEELPYSLLDYDVPATYMDPQSWLIYMVDMAEEQLPIENKFDEELFLQIFVIAVEEILSRLKESETAVSTTLVLDEVIRLKLSQQSAFLSRPENIYLPASYIDSYLRGEEKHQLLCEGREALCLYKEGMDLYFMQQLYEQGVLLLLGTDAGTVGMGLVPGFAVHDELQILVDNGLTPYEALRTSTVDAARIAGRITGDSGFGVVEEGFRADLLLVAGNPLIDVSVVRDLQGVMVSGKWFDRSTLDNMLTAAEK